MNSLDVHIVPLLITMTLISVFATGILMLLVLTKRNRLQLTLVGILGVFFVIMLMVMINMVKFPDRIDDVFPSLLVLTIYSVTLIFVFIYFLSKGLARRMYEVNVLQKEEEHPQALQENEQNKHLMPSNNINNLKER